MGTIPYRQFLLSDGTTDADSGILHAVDLLDRVQGFCITGWAMRTAETKGGGVWADSSLADGRFLKLSKRANVQEVLTVEITDFDADGLADRLHALYDLLEQARNWGPSGWSTTPVWIEAVGVNESNVRYALVHDYRTPGAGYPFGQPFWQTVIQSGISEFEIVLEREPAWRGNYPGDADCVPISAMQEMDTGTFPLVFGDTPALVELGSPAALDDLPSGDFTVEAWVYAESWGGTSTGTIADKSGNNTLGWTFRHTGPAGLTAIVYCDTVNAISESGPQIWGPTKFNEWHHVAFTFDNVMLLSYLWIDGQEVASYQVQQGGLLAPIADAAATAQIGNIANGTRPWDGEIGWVRVSDNQRYTAAFTPPPKCVLPADDANTAWLGIFEGTGVVIQDMSSNANDGTASNTTWGDACRAIYGNYNPSSLSRETSCAIEFAYVANKHNTIGLTHVYVEDGGVFGANLLGVAPPYSLLPAVPAANDRVYFGIDSTVADAGPFCSLVFDLSQAQANIADIDWEYWNGVAWVALTVQDNTDANGAMTGAAFDTTGIKSVHWAQDASWSTSTVNGVTALWVRAEVQDAGTQPPIQQNRHVYSILWPYVEVQADDLNGNVPALARIYLWHQENISQFFLTRYNRVMVGLRSVDRGEYFSPYLNLSDRETQNFAALTDGAAITFTNIGTGTDVADQTSPTGRALAITNPAAAAAVCSLYMNDVVVAQYQGTFHLFIRGVQTSGAAGDLSLRIYFTTASPAAATLRDSFYTSDWVEFESTDDWQILDFGLVTIDTGYGDFGINRLTLVVEAQGDGSADAKLYDLILLPVDEWAIEAKDTKLTESSMAGYRRQADTSSYPQILNVDAVSDPRQWRVSVHASGNDAIFANWQGRAPEGPILLPNTRQRLWFVATGESSTSEQSFPRVCGSVQAWANERYLLMRGDK